MATAEKPGRDQSTIAFPYVDLEESIRLAGAILAKGGRPLDRDQLAVGVGMVPTSGAFGAKVGAARMFGLIESSQARYALTDLGFEILDASREAAAKARAFLSVELYDRVFSEFRGRQLPPRPHGLEQAFVAMGVAPKQKERARQIFDRSARTAGFFATPAEDRLVMPVVGAGAPSEPVVMDSVALVQRAPPTPVRDLHPFIEGLLESLPEEGSMWSSDRRAKWLQTASNIFDIIYEGSDGAITIASVKAGSQDG